MSVRSACGWKARSSTSRLKDEFEEYYDVDPHTPVVPREPIAEDIDVAVLGGGFAGLLSAAQLKQAGVDDVRIIEKGGDFGGVWYWNRYPGIQCDNESYCYVPLLEELNFIPSKKFADGAEIFEHCRRIGKHYGLYDGAIFSTQVTRAALGREHQALANRNRPRRRHPRTLRCHGFRRLPIARSFQASQVSRTSRGTAFTPRAGTTSTPAAIPTEAWTSSPTRRVAVVGTGATGIQVIPFLGEYAKHLYVFQRTPSTVDARNNTATDQDWAKSLQPGWQKERQRNFHAWTFEGMAPGQPDYVCDFWTELGRNTAAPSARA